MATAIIFLTLLIIIIYLAGAAIIWDVEQNKEKIARARKTMFWPWFLLKYYVVLTFKNTKLFLFTCVNIVTLALFKKDLSKDV